jgi:general nucleoside transport system permease protein
VNELALFIATAFASGTVLAVAGLGLLVNERVGVINLGAEGLMLMSAVTGFAVAVNTGSPWLAFLAGAAAAAVVAAAFGWLVIWLNANQYATGLAVTLFGTGFSAFVGVPYVGRKLEIPLNHSIPVLGDIPFLGVAIFRQHPVVYLALLLALFLAWFFWRTRAGLVLRAIGESPESAHALGYPVRPVRLAAVVAGGAMCGLAGTFLSVAYTPLWVERMTAGRGWIALALTVFATWRPGRILLGAYLFGGVNVLQLTLQAQGVQLPAEFMSMAPYLVTIAVLCLISSNPAWIRLNMPSSLGKPFFPSQ